MAKQTFTSGQVLTATQMNNLQTNDFNLSTSVQTGNYTLVVGDRGTRVIANSASAIAFTVNTSIFSAGDIVEIHNIGAGTLTITAGTATVTSADVLTVAQWQGGTLYFTSASAAIWFPRAKQPGSTLVAGASFSASSTVNIDNVFSSTYRNYQIVIEITGTTGASAQIISVQLRTGGTAATGANYNYARSGYNWTSGVINADTANGATYWFIPRSNGSGSINGASMSSFTISSPNLAAPTWFNGTSTDGAYAASIGGVHTLSTAYDGFNIATTTGGTNITGVYRVYGLRD